ncbi:MAG: hypothetical protein EPN84_03150 [Legionella sp.]|nr:MAG: hypothetical protein EPN84_03150 [Legionella sp.]
MIQLGAKFTEALMIIEVQNLSDQERIELAKLYLPLARRLLKNDHNLYLALEHLENSRTLLTGLANADVELNFINILTLYACFLIQTNGVQLPADVEMPSLDTIKNEINSSLSEAERTKETPSLAILHASVINPEENFDVRDLLISIYQYLDLNLENSYRNFLARFHAPASAENQLTVLNEMRAFILNAIQASKIISVRHGQQKIQEIILQLFNLVQEYLNSMEPEQSFPVYKDIMALYGVVIGCLNEVNCDTNEIGESFRKLTEKYLRPLIAKLTQKLNTLDDDEQLTAFANQLDEYQKFIPEFTNAGFAPFAEFMQLKLMHLNKCIDKEMQLLATVNQRLSNNEVLPANDIKQYDEKYRALAIQIAKLTTLTEKYSTDGFYWQALNKKAQFKDLNAGFTKYSLNSEARTAFLKQQKDAAQDEISTICNQEKLARAAEAVEVKTIGKILPKLYTIIKRYLDLCAINESLPINQAHCAQKAKENAELFLALYKKSSALNNAYAQFAAEIAQLNEQMESSPAYKEGMILLQYNQARKDKTHPLIIQFGRSLLDIFDGRFNDEAEEKRVVDLCCEMADSYFSLESMEINQRKNEAFKLLRKAAKLNNTSSKKACNKLKDLLEKELVAQTTENQTTIQIKREIDALRKRLNPLSVVIPTESAPPAELTPAVQSAIPGNTPFSTTTPTLPPLLELFAKMAVQSAESVNALHTYRRHYADKMVCRASLMEFILSKNDAELKLFSADVLLDVGLGLLNNFYVTPSNNNRLKVLERLFLFASYNPQLKVAGYYQLAKLYGHMSNRHAEAVIYYEEVAKAGASNPLEAAKAKMALIAYYKDQGLYDKALNHRDVLELRCTHPSEQQPLQLVLDNVQKMLGDVALLKGIKESIPSTPSEISRSKPRESKRPIVFFDVDNTIFRSQGDDDRFYLDLKGNIRPAFQNLNDFKQFYIGTASAWRDLFSQIEAMGVDIGLCTAKPEEGRTKCPLFGDLITSFPEVFANNPHIIFTNGGDKYPPLLAHCRDNPFKKLKREYCILVDDLPHNKDRVKAAGFTFVDVHGLAESKDPTAFERFKTILLNTIAEKLQQFKQEDYENNPLHGSEYNSDEETPANNASTLDFVIPEPVVRPRVLAKAVSSNANPTLFSAVQSTSKAPATKRNIDTAEGNPPPEIDNKRARGADRLAATLEVIAAQNSM